MNVHRMVYAGRLGPVYSTLVGPDIKVSDGSAFRHSTPPFVCLVQNVCSVVQDSLDARRVIKSAAAAV